MTITLEPLRVVRPLRERKATTMPGASFDAVSAFDEHGSALLGYAVNVLHDKPLAEDVVQEAFLRAWRARGTFDPARGSERTSVPVATLRTRAFYALRLTDPAVGAEIGSLRAVARVAASVGTWEELSPGVELRERIARLAQTDGGADDARASEDDEGDAGREALSGARVTSLDSRRRRPWLLALGAAACVAFGVLGGSLIPRGVEAPVVGPPGTLGALEQVSFEGLPDGVDIDADLVAHTWGTETVLAIDGLDVGADYTVVVTDTDGREIASGSFFGSEAEVDCRMNAAVLREDVASVSIVDAGGAAVAVAEVPPVAS